MKSTLTPIAFCTILGLAVTGCSHGQSNLDTITSEIHEPERVGSRWDSGSLNLEMISPAGLRKEASVRFSGQRGRELRSLSIVTSDWSIDLSSHVRGLAFPYPTRMALMWLPFETNDMAGGMVAILPYRSSENGAPGPCMTAEIAIADRNVRNVQISHMAETVCEN